MRYVDGMTGDAAFSDEERSRLDTFRRKIAGAGSLGQIMDTVLRDMHPVLPCDRVSVGMLQDEGRRLVAREVRTRYEPVYLKGGFAGDVQGSSLQRMLEERKPRIISDLEAYGRDHPDSQTAALLVREGIRSSMTCPLVADDRPVGALFLSSKQKNAYGEHEVRLHHAIVESLSQSVEKAWRIEELTRANRAYMELLAFVTHELKSPLASMLLNTRMLTHGYLGRLTEQQRERLERVNAQGDYMVSLVNEYLDLARLEGGDMELHRRPGVDVIAAVVEPALDVIKSDLEKRGMSLKRAYDSESLAADCDPALMKIVMFNLLSNAVKYGREGGEVSVQAGIRDGKLTLSVRNPGVGFKASDRDRLFRRFSRLHEEQFAKIKGTGVGLYTCWRIVQLHKGRIEAASEYGQWAEFTVRIPLGAESQDSAGE